jgi:ribosome-binding factor A
MSRSLTSDKSIPSVRQMMFSSECRKYISEFLSIKQDVCDADNLFCSKVNACRDLKSINVTLSHETSDLSSEDVSQQLPRLIRLPKPFHKAIKEYLKKKMTLRYVPEINFYFHEND